MISATGVQIFTLDLGTGVAGVTSDFKGTDLPDPLSPGSFLNYDLYNIPASTIGFGSGAGRNARVGLGESLVDRPNSRTKGPAMGRRLDEGNRRSSPRTHRSAIRSPHTRFQRMLIENNVEDGVNFFHWDALSSAVALKVNGDVQLTLMASSLYRYSGQRIGQGYEVVKSRHLFGDFIDATATLEIDERTVRVSYRKRATTPCCWPPASITSTREHLGGESESSLSSAEPRMV